MRTSPLLSSLTLGLFLLVPSVHAVNYTGEAVLDWSTLQVSGIPITIAASSQTQNIYVDPQHFLRSIFSDWRPHTLIYNAPQVATATSSASSTQLDASFNTFGRVGSVEAYREAFFTATDTGQLTVSIDYTLQQIGQSSLSSGLPTSVVGYLILTGERIPGGGGGTGIDQGFDQSQLTSSSGDSLSGTLHLTESFYRGETGSFAAAAYASAGVTGESSVPLPDMLWPTLAGMIGIAFWAERRRRQTGLTS